MSTATGHSIKSFHRELALNEKKLYICSTFHYHYRKIAIAYRSTVFECLDVTNIVAAAHEACRALPLDSMPEKTYSANQPTSSFAGSEQLYLWLFYRWAFLCPDGAPVPCPILFFFDKNSFFGLGNGDPGEGIFNDKNYHSWELTL